MVNPPSRPRPSSSFSPARLAVGELIRARRKALDLSQDGLAILVGLTQTPIGEIELGHRRVPAHRIALFIEHLEIPAAEFMALWVAAEGSMTLELPPDAHPLAAQVFVMLVQVWPRLVASKGALERGTLAVMRWALVKLSQPTDAA